MPTAYEKPKELTWETKLEILTARINELVPETKRYDSIELVHVLAAINNFINSWTFSIYANGVFRSTFRTDEAQWDLGSPLHGQSEKSIDYLIEVLNEVDQ